MCSGFRVFRMDFALTSSTVEIIGLFTKPFALTVRLFANMASGKVLVYSIIGLHICFLWHIRPMAVAWGTSLDLDFYLPCSFT